MDQDHQPCRVVLLDTQTGERRDGPEFRFNLWWWAEGNGSCDCNRMSSFDRDDDSGYCVGAHRYLIVGCDVPGVSLAWLNSSYPPDLLNRHLPQEAMR